MLLSPRHFLSCNADMRRRVRQYHVSNINQTMATVTAISIIIIIFTVVTVFVSITSSFTRSTHRITAADSDSRDRAATVANELSNTKYHE